MRKEVVEQVSALITTAFGLVAALAWNSAIQEWFAAQETLRAGGPWVYAILVTAVAVGVTVWIGRVAAAMDKEPEEGE
jgi:TRAP-type C4-dicarboxylate transport system permease small subunit